jgi:hypothetical protein
MAGGLIRPHLFHRSVDDPIYQRYGIETQVNEKDAAVTLLQKFRHIGYTRAKYFRVPCFLVESLDELHRLIDIVASRVKGKLLFRGQTRHYSLRRPDSEPVSIWSRHRR